MRIVNPSFGLEPGDGNQNTEVTRQPTDWKSDAIAIVSNSKPNARELLEGLRDQLSAHRSIENVDYFFKDSAAQPAPETLYDKIATRHRAAILALAD